MYQVLRAVLLHIKVFCDMILWQVNSSDISKDYNAFIEGQSVQEHCDTMKVKVPRSSKMPITLHSMTKKTLIFMNNNP